MGNVSPPSTRQNHLLLLLLNKPYLSFEENLGLIAVNVPVMVPLYRLLREKVPSGYGLMRSYLRKSSSSGGTSASQHSSRNRAFQRMKDANQNDAPVDMDPLSGITKTVDTSVDIV